MIKILTVFMIIGILDIICGGIYLATGLFKTIYHNFMGWHMPVSDARTTFDGCSCHNICKYCGKEIMKDSQGNWF